MLQTVDFLPAWTEGSVDSGLPAGAQYTVTEKEVDGYTTTVTETPAIHKRYDYFKYNCRSKLYEYVQRGRKS